MKERWITFLVRTSMIVFASLAIASLSVRGTFSASLPSAEAGGLPVTFGRSGHRVQGRMYQETPEGNGRPLVIVLHGDAPGRKPAYQYDFASRLSRTTGARVIALLRPGYADPFGGRSDGDRGLFAVGENYTPEVERDLATAITEAKQRFAASRVLLIGHSGGAVLAADIAAFHKGLIRKVVLVSCPCDVVAFRRHMAVEQWNPLWLLPVRAVSPLQTLAEMSATTSVLAITGENDQVALPVYASEYVAAAERRMLDAHFVGLTGKAHEVLLDPEVIRLVEGEMRQ